MKKYLILTLMMCLWIGISSASKGSAQPSIEFATKTHDFGTIHESKGSVTCQFKFTNKGDAPLVIVSATAGCGCTTPTFDGDPIAPGKSSAVTVSYSPKGRPGEFSKNVTVRTNDPKNRKVVLKITGVVVP